MHYHTFLPAIILHIGISLAQTAPLFLNLTAIAAVDKASVIQCWQLTGTPITTVPGPLGLEAQLLLGDVSNMTWASLPANFSMGSHDASNVEYNVVLSGTLHITFETSNQSAVIHGGAHGIILVTDTSEVSTSGHIATLGPEGRGDVLFIPIKGGIVPEHTVLHCGQCHPWEMNL